MKEDMDDGKGNGLWKEEMDDGRKKWTMEEDGQ